GDLPDHLVDVQRLELQRLLARISEKLLRQLLCAQHARRGGLDDPAYPGNRGAALLQKLEIAADDRQHIVEIMCDPAGEPAQRLELLRLPQLGFCRSKIVRRAIEVVDHAVEGSREVAQFARRAGREGRYALVAAAGGD